MLRFESVDYSYGQPGARPALADVSFVLDEGEILAVLGANGSGKSTLVRLANGLFTPQHGAVSVDGMDTRDATTRRAVREAVGMVFQRPDDQIVATSVLDEVAFGPENLGLPRGEIRARCDHAIAAVGLSGLENREPHLLSGGQKQRLAIAGALAMGSRHLVLDEPTSMIDSQGRAEVLTLLDELRSAGHAILHVTHDLAEAMRADRILVLSGGQVAFEGAPAEIASPDVDVSAWGLEAPALMRLSWALRDSGIRIPPDAATVSEFLEALWD